MLMGGKQAKKIFFPSFTCTTTESDLTLSAWESSLPSGEVFWEDWESRVFH